MYNIMKIRAEIYFSETNMSNSETRTQRVVEHPMTDLAATSEGEVQRIIQAAKPKSSSLDPLPTSLLKCILPAHIPTLTHLINVSLSRPLFLGSSRRLS